MPWIALFFVLLFFQISDSASTIAWSILMIIILTIGALYLRGKSQDKLVSKHLEDQREYVKTIAYDNRELLARKRAHLIIVDGSGNIYDKKWNQEIVSFFNKKVHSFPSSIVTNGVIINGEEIADIINQIAEKAGVEMQADHMKFDSSMDGLQYEYFCANILKESGWNAKVSQASGDQGADIVAVKIDIPSVAIQCKKYSKPVGNKAVQEILGGKIFYNTKFAAVVSNNSYTNSAKQLAKSSGVLLLSHADLPHLEKIVTKSSMVSDNSYN